MPDALILSKPHDRDEWHSTRGSDDQAPLARVGGYKLTTLGLQLGSSKRREI